MEEDKRAVQLDTSKKLPKLSQVELKSLVIIAKYYERTLKDMDIQNSDYPYYKATTLDLYRLLGEEVLARNPEQKDEPLSSGSEQTGA